jgi:hypothetical protein
MIASGLQIGTLRAPTSAGDVAARLPIERALSAADLCPSGLPAGAVLIVRRLATSRPSTGLAWERAARAQLAALYRQAARPARGEGAADAEAVLFADSAELLACLAEDIVADVAASRWWWRCCLRGRPAHVAQLHALLGDELAALPAALSMLAARGRAVAVLRALPPPAARALAERLATTYGAGSLPLPGTSTAPNAPHLLHSGVDSLARESPARSAGPPWPALPPELAREHQLLLGLALAIAARPAAPRAPAFRRALAAWWRAAGETVRLPEASAGDEQRAAPSTHASDPPSSLNLPLVAPPDAPAPQATLGVPSEAARPEPDEGVGMLSPAQPTDLLRFPDASDVILLETSDVSLAAAARPAPPHQPMLDQASLPPASQPAPKVATDDRAIPADVAPPHVALPGGWSSDPASEKAPSLEAAAAHDTFWPGLAGTYPTELGGVLFLINLLIYLGLPETFVHAWPLERAIGAWGLLELFARGLLAAPAAYADDPLWGVLAQLDGRAPGAAPGAGDRLGRAALTPRPPLPLRQERGSTARDYRIPVAWLRALPDDPAERFYWASTRRRLRLWSSRGYVLFDGRVRRRGDAAARAILSELGATDRALECAGADQPALEYQLSTTAKAAKDAKIVESTLYSSPLRSLRSLRFEFSTMEGVPAWLRRWLALSLPYARLRLALALGLDPADDLDRPLLARRGALYVSTTHVDLMLSLESTSIAVRLAGLDRNPGWIAEYGRVVLFHFVAPGE